MEINLNGAAYQTGEVTVFSLRDRLFDESCVAILNGFQLSQDQSLSPGDEVFIIAKGVMPPKGQLESMMAARHTPKVHQKLKAAKVGIAGLGGLGSNIAVSLARIGVGHLLLVDFDVVEPSNLNRQSYYIRHLGLPKPQALLEQIGEINPFIKVDTKLVKVEEHNAAALFSGCHVVCEAFDNPAAKAMLVAAVLEQLPGTKVVAASGMAGYGSSNSIQTTRKMKNLYLCGDLESGAEVGRGLMAPRVQVCAGHQANMVLRLLLGIEEV